MVSVSVNFIGNCYGPSNLKLIPSQISMNPRYRHSQAAWHFVSRRNGAITSFRTVLRFDREKTRRFSTVKAVVIRIQIPGYPGRFLHLESSQIGLPRQLIRLDEHHVAWDHGLLHPVEIRVRYPT